MKRALTIWALTTAAAMAQTTVTGSKTMQGSWDASGAAATKPVKSGASLPATCGVGEFFFNTAAAAGQNVYLCSTANTWTQLSGGVNSVFGRTGAVSAQTGDYNFSQLSGSAAAGQLPAAGGDLSGTLSAATVKGIQGKTVSATAPSNGQVLTWNGSQWTPLAVSSAVGGDLSGTIAAATVQGIQGRAVSATAPSGGQVLTWNGSAWIPQTVSSALGGDLSGTSAAATVQAIQGQAVSGSLPATGEVLTWSGSSWGAQFPTGGGGVNAPALAIVFDGSTVIPGETMTAWSCGATSCTTSWTIPLNVNFVYVQAWGGGSAGTSASGGAGGGAGGAGGSGGGYGDVSCPVAPGSSYTVQVGLGGTANGAGFGTAVTQAGSSSLQGCIGATGGTNAVFHFAGPPGVMSFNGVTVQEAYIQNNGSANPLFYGGSTASNSVTTPGPIPISRDGGGYGAGGWNTALGTSTGAGFNGGFAYGGGGGGGSGASQNATGGAGGVSLWGGHGGNGGNSGAACTAGVIPAGGGGGAYVGVAGNSTTACNGARGEVRIYYVR